MQSQNILFQYKGYCIYFQYLGVISILISDIKSLKKKPRTQRAGATDYKTVKRVLRSVDDQKLIPEMVAILNLHNVSSCWDLPNIHSLAEWHV